MAILKLAVMGHPVLKRRADEVDDPTAPEILRLIDDMIATLDDAGGVGLAAPQIYVPFRVVIFEVPAARLGIAESETLPRTVLINPVITPLSDQRELGWEGCLSVPGLRGAVPRFTEIGYRGLDASGRTIEREARGFHARVVQHECDHLDGMLYPMRMADLASLHFVSEMRHNPTWMPAPDEDLAWSQAADVA